MSDETREKHFSDADGETEFGSKAAEGAGKGSAIGGTAGAVIGAIAAIGTSVALPGLGLLVAGPIAGALLGAGAGGATGGLIGALIGSGIPEDRAKEYEEGVKQGGIVVGFNARDEKDAEYFERNWNEQKGEGVYRGETPIPVVEEELQVGKREVEQHTETVRETLRRTEVEVEPLDLGEQTRAASASPLADDATPDRDPAGRE